MIKRFEKSVEAMLIGKYGLAWCEKTENYKTVHFYSLFFNHDKTIYQTGEQKESKCVFPLLGILEYEHRKLHAKVRRGINGRYLRGKLYLALVSVRAEIQKLQGGKG